MMRGYPIAVLVLVSIAAAAQGQDWAQKMFAVRSYDFGTIARGAKAEFAFE